jgi:hypothetical protein
MARYNKEADRRQQERKEALSQDKIVTEKYGSWTNMYHLELQANRNGKLFFRGYEKTNG